MKKILGKISVMLLLSMLLVSVLCIPAQATDTEPLGGGYYGEDMLSDDKENYLYDIFEKNLLGASDTGEVKASIEIDKEKKILPDTASYVLDLFLGDHPECFWVANGMSYSTLDGYVVEISPQYYVQGSDLVGMRDALEERISYVLEAMDKKNFTTDYDKALYLHDAVAAMVEYRQEGMHQTSMGALVYGYAVCSGYASAYQLLLQRAGIKAFTVSGDGIDPKTGKSEPHAWTLMEIDGECVYTDVTWDDQGENLYHAYFCLSLDEMSKTHFTDGIYTLPTCGHEKKSYFEVKGNKFNDVDGTEGFKALIVKRDDSTCTASFLYTGKDIEKWLKDNILEIYSSLGGSGKISYSISSIDGECYVEMTGDFSGAGMPNTPDDAPIEIPTVDTSGFEIPDGNTFSSPVSAAFGCGSRLYGHTFIVISFAAAGLVLVLIRKKRSGEKG